MKKLITLVLTTYLCLSNLNAQTNLITNPSFEADAATFLVNATDGTSLPDQLRRISSTTGTYTSSTYPAPAAPASAGVTVTDGLWLKNTNIYSTVYCQRATTAPANSTTYSMLMKVLGGSTSSIDWTKFAIQQRLILDNTKKYTLTFYANTSASTGSPTFTAFIADKNGVTVANVTSQTITPTIKSLTKYTATFDLPSAIVGNAALDYTTAYVGVGFNPTYSSGSTQSSALYLDEFTLTEASPSTSVTNIFSNSKVYSVNSEIVIEGCSSQNLSIYSGLGQLIKSIKLNSDRVSVPVKNGLYFLNIGDKNYKVLVK